MKLHEATKKPDQVYSEIRGALKYSVGFADAVDRRAKMPERFQESTFTRRIDGSIGNPIHGRSEKLNHALDIFGKRIIKGADGSRPAWHSPKYWGQLRSRRPDVADAEWKAWQEYLEECVSKQAAAASIWRTVSGHAAAAVPNNPADLMRHFAELTDRDNIES